MQPSPMAETCDAGRTERTFRDAAVSGHFRLLSASFGGDAVDGEGLLAHLGRERAERKREMPRLAAPRLTPERWSDNDAAVVTGNEFDDRSPPSFARTLPAVPVVDVRDGGPPQHAVRSAAKARALRDACLRFFPAPRCRSCRRSTGCRAIGSSGRARPMWRRSPTSRRRSICRACGSSMPRMQWGCTALAGEEDGAPWLVRTLDWPFQGPRTPH